MAKRERNKRERRSTYSEYGSVDRASCRKTEKELNSISLSDVQLKVTTFKKQLKRI